MFQPDRLYLTDDPDLLAILEGKHSRQSWRCEKRGPAYMKAGKRVYYRGDDLNAFLNRHRVEPRDAA